MAMMIFWKLAMRWFLLRYFYYLFNCFFEKNSCRILIIYSNSVFLKKVLFRNELRKEISLETVNLNYPFKFVTILFENQAKLGATFFSKFNSDQVPKDENNDETEMDSSKKCIQLWLC